MPDVYKRQPITRALPWLTKWKRALALTSRLPVLAPWEMCIRDSKCMKDVFIMGTITVRSKTRNAGSLAIRNEELGIE